LDELELLKEQTKSRHDKTKPHQGQTGANPGKECSLGSQRITQVGSLSSFHREVTPSNIAQYSTVCTAVPITIKPNSLARHSLEARKRAVQSE
jgi:hypothetical protein